MIIRSRTNGQRKTIRKSTCPPGKKAHLRGKILHVAPAPFKFLPDNVEERDIGQRGQWQGFLGPANGDCRSSFDSDWRTAVQGQKDRILGVAHFNFDERRFRHDNRSVRENMRANRRNNENPRFRIENRSAGRKRICRRTGRCCDNQTISVKFGKRLAVDPRRAEGCPELAARSDLGLYLAEAGFAATAMGYQMRAVR